VENNSAVAVECLLKLTNGENGGMEFLSPLVEMEMSFHSIEVVNGLNLHASSEKDLPKDFIHRYISHCITSCEAMLDKYLQVSYTPPLSSLFSQRKVLCVRCASSDWSAC
jgi:hypothetical protein